MDRPDTFSNLELETIEKYSAKLFQKAVEGTEQIKRLSDDKAFERGRYGLNQLEWFSVFNEFHFFFLHLTDRTAFGKMDEKRRGIVMSGLEKWSIDLSVDEICKDGSQEKIRSIKSECVQNFMNSMDEYSKYQRRFPEEGESPKDTLFWEFGKKVTELAGRGTAASFIMCALEFAVKAHVDLDMKGFVDKMK